MSKLQWYEQSERLRTEDPTLNLKEQPTGKRDDKKQHGELWSKAKGGDCENHW